MSAPTTTPAAPVRARGFAQVRPGGRRFFLLIGCLTAIGPASMDIYLPALPQLSSNLSVGSSLAQLTVTTYVVGLGIGQLVSGPLSDVHGRRRPMAIAFALYAVVSTLCALAPNIWVLAGTRFAQGMLASGGMVIGRAIVRDLYAGEAAARYLSRLYLIIGLAPILAPIVGGQILRFTSWRGVFVAVALLGVVFSIAAALFLPETHPHEKRRAAGVGETWRTFGLLARDRRFLGFAVILSFGSSAMIGYIAASPFVMQDVYGASPQLYSVLFGINGAFLVIGAQVNALLVGRFASRRLLGIGVASMFIAGTGVLAVVLSHASSVVFLMLPLAFMMFSWNPVQANATALALLDHPRVAGSAVALLGVGQFVFSAIMAPIVGVAGKHSAVPMAVVILSCGTIAVFALRTMLPGSRATAAAAPG